MVLMDSDDEGGGYDLLSSIEVVIFDQMHHMLMQNWEHVEVKRDTGIVI